ncbi:MAG: AIR synthase related protein [Deltaproteobacteria bacterium]|nr:AIR synthase related protein [Deltaproteobacteria bacterium]
MDPSKIALAALREKTRTYLGLVRKRPIEEIHEKLLRHGVAGPHLPNYGDDAAVIPFGDQYLLFAADGMMTALLVNEPYAAGKASVMVTVNDVYSMGGKPIAMVNVLASGDAAQRTRIIQGIRKGCEKLNVPMVGGHLHPDAPSDTPSLSVAILGQARHLLRSHLARPGDDLMFAADLDGRAGCASVVSWDANSGKSTTQLLHRMEALPIVAENQWAHACKDVSNAGLLGTAAIMMENSGRGAVIDVPAIPCPPQLSLLEWIVSFQSFGFILSVPPQHTQSVIDLFHDRSIAAAVVGSVTQDRKVFLRFGSETELLFDFERDKITGIVYRPETED